MNCCQKLLFVGCCLLVVTGCKKTDPVATSGSDSAKVLTDAQLSIGAPVSYENLTIFPIQSRQPRTSDRFLTLDQGLKQGTIQILEGEALGGESTDSDSPNNESSNEQSSNRQSSSAVTVQREANPFDSNFDNNQANPQGSNNNVNELYVINKSDKPLYLMPGEIVLGGDQDRMIAQETIISPGDKPVSVAVYCVEQGRWGNRAESETAQTLDLIVTQTQSVADVPTDQLAKEANRGKFVASAGNVSRKVRIAGLIDKKQDAVWKNVKDVNVVNQVETESDTFSSNYADEESIKRIQAFVKRIQNSIGDCENVVGVVVAVNGKVQTMDAFESTPLFKKLWPKLLKSYALDAVTTPDPRKQKEICKLEDANKFMAEILKAHDAKIENAIGTQVGQTETKNAHCISSRYLADGQDSAKLEGGFGGGGFGGGGGGLGGVHSSGFSK